MASFKPRGVAGGGGRLDLPQYSYLSPARPGLGLSLAKDDKFSTKPFFMKTVKEASAVCRSFPERVVIFLLRITYLNTE